MLRLAYQILELPAGDGQRIVAYLPADDTTAQRLDRLGAGERDGTGTAHHARVNASARRRPSRTV